MVCLLSALFWLAPPALPTVAPNPRSYERLAPPHEMSIQERHVFLGIRHWVQEHQGVLRWDARLAHVAAATLAHSETSGLDLEALRQAAWQQGWTDGELAATRVQAAGHQATAAVLQALQVQGSLPAAPRARRGWVDMNRVGIVVRGEEVLVLLSRRLVHWAPVPAQVEPGQEFVLVGRVSKSAGHVQRVQLAVAYPDGHVRSAQMPVSQGVFEQRVHAGDEVGVLSVQALVDRGFGPEVASLLPVGVGQSPWTGTPRDLSDLQDKADGKAVQDPRDGQATAVPPTTAAAAAREAAPMKADPRGPHEQAPKEPDGRGTGAPAESAEGQRNAVGSEAELAQEALLRLVWGARAARGLSRPQLHSELARAAQQHADEMQRLRYFAHVSPTGGDAVRRLAAQGVHEQRVLENLAAAPSADAAFAQWMNSPAHRANLLDAQVSQMGLGTAHGDGLLAVLLLAQPADSGTDAQLTARVLQRLNQARSEQGWPPLRPDMRLSAMAQRRSQQNAHAGALADSRSDVAAALAGGDDALREAAADSYRSDSVDAVTQSTHLAEPFDRVGVGVSQSPSGTGPRLWITVVYGA